MKARTAVRVERYLMNTVVALALVAGLIGGAWLELEWDLPDGVGAIVGVIVPTVAIGCLYWLVKSFLPTPACPRCHVPWDAMNDRSWKQISAGRCPRCNAAV